MRATVLAVAAAALVSAQAHATYSIVATDSSTQLVGGAGTSCVGGLSVTIIYGSAPGIGAVHAQAQVNQNGRDQAVTMLEGGAAPADIIAAITSPGFDGNASARQYGIADLAGRAAGFSGATNGPFSDDRQGTLPAFTYSIQGNILTSEAVLTQAEAAFTGGGCDLPDRLMLALEAGADNGEGDSRCTGGGIPSDSGFIRVDRADGSTLLSLDVTDTSPQNPVVLLRQQFDQWRQSNPCPTPADAGALGPDGGSITGDAGSADGDGDGGCGCSAPGRSGGLWLALVFLLCCGTKSRWRPKR